MPGHGDRLFDDLAARLAEKVYGGIKGRLRLDLVQQDLQAFPLISNRPLRVLDIGGGDGRMSAWLAGQGHEVIYSEPA
ncbi:MAG: SAM-dependent methyltransferase, partial [Gammaproteobacteria bacterium]